ncbi:MAG: TetR/AcrR family transcriptional regulator [Alphaproteobacteria bacterium]|nr:TetR/AcrR family transcriptional regulator [Alphaproteobacteria bacterium]
MSRPREYDRDDALDAAMRTFWRYGYERTSYPVLEKAMNMNRGSIYAAFGDKQALYFEALDSYIAHRNHRMETGLGNDAAPIKTALQAYFTSVIDFSLGEGEYCGCMLANSAVELGPFDETANERIWNGFLDTEEILVKRLEKAQAQGQLGIEKDARLLAQIFINTLIGIRVTLRMRKDRARAVGIIDETLRLLD